MRLKLPGSRGSLHQTVRKGLRSTTSQSQWLRSISDSSKTPKDIGIIGGGVTGLTAAFTILQTHKFKYPSTPPPKITIYESGPRLGGWLQSPTVKTPGGDEVVFEQGPRTLRTGSAASFTTLDLIYQLGLISDIIGIAKGSPMLAARYVYYRNSLQMLPPPWSQLIEDLKSEDSLFRGLGRSLIGDLVAGKQRPPHIEDESVGDLITRRFNRDIADKFATAMMHGIYAGDAWKLSAEAVLPRIWYADGEADSILLEMWRDASSTLYDAQHWEKLRSQLKVRPLGELEYLWIKSSVFTLRGGLEQLTRALEMAISLTGNVTIKMNTAVETLKLRRKDNMVELTVRGSTTKHKPITHTHIVSTVLAPTLSKMARIPILSKTPAVTVGLVNLFYSDPNLLKQQGFGYLIPNTPTVQNPTSALGVIFDSCVIPDKVPGTKLTVMLGGHYWDTKHPEGAGIDKDMLYDMAKRTLATQLGITTQPTVWAANIWKNAIPQYTVGHRKRMVQAHEDITANFGGRLIVAGSSFNGVGVNDCVQGAKQAASSLLAEKGDTGLESYMTKPVYVPTPKLDI